MMNLSPTKSYNIEFVKYERFHQLIVMDRPVRFLSVETNK